MDTREKLKQLLEKSGWTEYRLAKACGLSEATIANIFKRSTTPQIDTLEKICAGFGISLSQFFSDGKLVELAPDQQELFDLWKSLSPKQKEAILNMLRAFSGAE